MQDKRNAFSTARSNNKPQKKWNDSFFTKLVVAGVGNMGGSKIEIEELEALVKSTNNEDLLGDLEDIKILHEKAKKLREEDSVAEADALDKRIHKKLERIHADASSSGNSFDSVEESEDWDERREKIKAYAKKHRMRPEDFDEDYRSESRDRLRYRHDRYMHDAMRHDARHHDGADDIHERHKDLMNHRRQDFRKRLDLAQFTAEEEAAIQSKIDYYFYIEEDVMASRMADRSKEARAAHRRKSKEQRDIARDEMKARRQEEKERMHEARELRKEIDNLIREKMSKTNFAGPEL